MKILKFTIILCDGLVVLLGLAFAFAYLFRPEFMSYHAVAVHEAWADVDPGFQILIIALMRVSGGGFLAISVAITMLLYQFHKQDKVWPVTAIFFIGQSILIPTLYATLLVKNHTGANPPWIAAAAAIGLLLMSPSGGKSLAFRRRLKFNIFVLCKTTEKHRIARMIVNTI